MENRSKTDVHKGTSSSSRGESSPVNFNFSSESEDLEEEWSSCAGDLEKDTYFESSPTKSNSYNNTKSENNNPSSSSITGKTLSSCGGYSFNIYSPPLYKSSYTSNVHRTSPNSKVLSPPLSGGKSSSSLQYSSFNSESKYGGISSYKDRNLSGNLYQYRSSSPNRVSPEPEDKRFVPAYTMKSSSHQRVVKNNEHRPIPIPGIHLETPSPTEFETISDDVNFKRRDSGHYQDAERPTSLIVGKPAALKPPNNKNNTSGGNIGRSVSFNDRLLDSPKKKPSEKLTQNESRYDKDTAPAPSNKRLLQSTPGRLQNISKSPPEVIDSAPSSPNVQFGIEQPQGKGSIKNLKSNLARCLSMRKPKFVYKPTEDTVSEILGESGYPYTRDAIVSYEALLRIFECPGCHKFMSPPFLQCRKGHIVCETCKVNLKATCPSCKQRITDISNRMIESVYQLVRFPCRFGKYGCREYFASKEKGCHEDFCVFRPVLCSFANLGCDRILPLKEIKVHIATCQYNSKDQKK